MDKKVIKEILKCYNITDIKKIEIINSSKEGIFKLNILIDKKYVLRINEKHMDEERLSEIDNIAKRYQTLGILTPRLLKNQMGKYSYPLFDNKIAFVSEYLDYDTCEKMSYDFYYHNIYPEVLNLIANFSKRYSNIDLSKNYSMWSIEKLTSFDNQIDEKQENLNLLIEYLDKIQEFEIVKKLKKINYNNRNIIKGLFEILPKTVIQGDLNPSNILVFENRFIGLIDFDMSGTEVNVNNFVSETNGFPNFEEVNEENYIIFINNWFKKQKEDLKSILEIYSLNKDEEKAIIAYRNIGIISQFSNVIGYLNILKKDQLLGNLFIDYILESMKKYEI